MSGVTPRPLQCGEAERLLPASAQALGEGSDLRILNQAQGGGRQAAAAGGANCSHVRRQKCVVSPTAE